ncbi:MAG: redox-regulated ATPase YchF [Candidatus Kapabacteria bacterium]|nr:redox-regulated ATPase YchF [Candidatus Kapabacteria bacterium]
MQIGIVGLPYSGKTTLFQTLTQIHLDMHALQKRDANQAIVKVPDTRLDLLSEIFQPKKKVNATIDIVDMVGIQRGERASQSFTSHFLTKVRTNDALIHVVRGFEDETIPHVDGSINLFRDIRTLEEEFIFADMAFVESRLEKLDKELLKSKNKDETKKEIEVMQRWNETLQAELPLRELEVLADDIKYLKNYQPLSAKPLLLALNLGESDTSRAEVIVNEIKAKIKAKNIRVEPFFAKIELELSQLSDEEKEMFMEEYGLKESPLSRLIKAAYELLGLQSFFTVGEDECRAWTIRVGMNAQESSGVIHTDFYNKFIRAEVIGYNDFIANPTLSKCREKGLLRLEGRDYILHNGDIINVRHG